MLSLIRQSLRKRGYEIRKAPFPKFNAVSVYNLALQYLLASRGENLTFICVGANDGNDDPLRVYIQKYRWRGVLIEPQPDVFAKLRANYAGRDQGLAFENVAISTNPAPLRLYRRPPNASDDEGITVASADPKTTAKQLHLKPNELEKIMVPTARLDDIVARYGLAAFDILQIDTEGFDWEVLQTLDLTKTRPWIIGFEHGHLSPAAIGLMTQHLNSHDYLVNFGGYESDSVALRNDFIFQ